MPAFSKAYRWFREATFHKNILITEKAIVADALSASLFSRCNIIVYRRRPGETMY